MPLVKGRLRKANNELCLFTMMNGAQEVECKISLAALAAISPRRPMETNSERFERIFDKVGKAADRKFFSFLDEDRPELIEIRRADVE